MEGLGREHWTVSDAGGHVVAVCFTSKDAERVRAALSTEAPPRTSWWATLFGQRIV